MTISWHKSTRSNPTGNCVEVLHEPPHAVHIRDSKNPEGTTLTFTPAEWKAFVEGVKNGDFDR